MASEREQNTNEQDMVASVRDLQKEISVLRSYRNKSQQELSELRGKIETRREENQRRAITMAKVHGIGSKPIPFDWQNSSDTTQLDMHLIDCQFREKDSRRRIKAAKDEIARLKALLRRKLSRQQQLRAQMLELPSQDQQPMEVLYAKLVSARHLFFETKLAHEQSGWSEERALKSRQQAIDEANHNLNGVVVKLGLQRKILAEYKTKYRLSKSREEPVRAARLKLLQRLWSLDATRTMEVAWGFFGGLPRGLDLGVEASLSRTDFESAVKLVGKACGVNADRFTLQTGTEDCTKKEETQAAIASSTKPSSLSRSGDDVPQLDDTTTDEHASSITEKDDSGTADQRQKS